MANKSTAALSTPSRLSRDEAKEQTRRRVLEAAEAVFRRDGYHGATLNRIAAEAGFTKGAVYSTFDSKADVMLVLLAERAVRRREELEDVFGEASNAWEALAEFSRRFAGGVDEERDWWATVIEFMVVVGRDESLRARYAEHHDATRETLTALLRRWMEDTGNRLTAPPERLATAAMALGNGLTVEGLLAPSEVPGDLYMDAQLALARGAIADREQQ